MADDVQDGGRRSLVLGLVLTVVVLGAIGLRRARTEPAPSPVTDAQIEGEEAGAEIEAEPEPDLARSPDPGPAPIPRVWLELEPGPHPVGYRQDVIFDPTRAYTSPVAPLPERAITVHRWYPGEASGEAMVVGDYLELEGAGGRADVARFLELLELHIRDVFMVETTMAAGGAFATSKQRGWVEAMLAEPVYARRDARARAGDWPVILYHPGLGGAYEDNFVLFEWLASHGYIVVSSAFVPVEEIGFAVDWDPATSIADLDALVRELTRTGELSLATPLAVMGHSYGAQAALIYAMERRRIDAVVSIDSTIENSDPKEPWFRSRSTSARWLDRAERIRVPSLILASHYARTTAFVDAMVRSDRRYAVVPVLDHNDFISHGGVLMSLHTHELRAGEDESFEREEYLAAYTWELETIRAFFDGVLGGDLSRLAALDDAGWASEVEGASIVHSQAQPTGELIDLWDQVEAEGAVAVFEACTPADPKAEPACDVEAVLVDFGLAYLARREPERARALMTELVDHSPRAYWGHDTLGEALLELGRPVEAAEAFERAAELAAAGKDRSAGWLGIRAKIARALADGKG